LFIKILCYILEKENAPDTSIFQIMTTVATMVSARINTTKKKKRMQIPQFNSRLTKDLKFGRKLENAHASVPGVSGIVNESNNSRLAN
jgi:hypothetical protein